MSRKTYTGSCHCQQVRFQVDLDLSEGTGRCNCSICTKTRNWGARAKPEHFKLLAGEEALGDYHRHEFLHYYFCRTCGVHMFSKGDIPEIGGAFVGVKVNVLDDLDPAELLAAPIRYSNGRDNKWRETPEEIRHL